MIDHPALSKNVTLPNHFPAFHREILITFIFFILPANGLIMLVSLSSSHIRSLQANKFIFAHSLLDLLVGLVFIPCLLCGIDILVLGGMIMYSLLVSLLILFFSTYDRFVAICKPLRYESIETNERVRNMICFSWLFPIIVVALPQAWLKRNDLTTFISTEHRVYLGVVVFGILGTLMVITIAYIRILIVGLKHLREQLILREFASNWARRLVVELKFSRMFFMLSLTFFIFWIPTGYMTVTDDIFLLGEPPRWLQDMNFYWIFVSSFLNPIIYAVFHKSYRKTIKVIFRYGRHPAAVVHPIFEPAVTSSVQRTSKGTSSHSLASQQRCRRGRLSTEDESMWPCRIVWLKQQKREKWKKKIDKWYVHFNVGFIWLWSLKDGFWKSVR